MTLLSNDPMTQLAFSIYENKGVFAVLLGSGLSRAADIPTGWEITLDLIRRVAKAQGADEQADWAQWYRSKTGQEPNYSTLLEELAHSPEERRSIMHSYIEPTAADREEGRKVPTKAHLAIADMVRAGFIRVIITTNFDRLMENALRERGVEPTIVASADALAGAEPITHSACYILKLHGDYKDARILNTDAELSAYPPDYDRLLDRILDEHGLIIAGWSGDWDHALRAAFLRAPNRRYAVYWAARGIPGTGAKQLIAHRGARMVPISDADGFFPGLLQRVETLAQSQRQNPLSIDLLVNSAKRLLAKPEYRIQLDELFTQEAERLIAKLDAPDLSPQGRWNQNEFQNLFQNRVKTYEAATEPLAKMAGVLGRWGDNSELPLIIDLLQMLYAHAEKVRGGQSAWLELRSYPAVLVFTAYALGLTRAERWATLKKLLAVQVKREHRRTAPVIEILYPTEWNGGHNDMWRQFEGLKDRKTALCDHLCDLFGHWGSSFCGLVPNSEVLFERFEMMASLAYLSGTPEEHIQAAVNKHGRHEYVAIPGGRICWDNSCREHLVQELKHEAMTKVLVDSAFVPSAAFIDLFVTNLEHLAWRLRW